MLQFDVRRGFRWRADAAPTCHRHRNYPRFGNVRKARGSKESPIICVDYWRDRMWQAMPGITADQISKLTRDVDAGRLDALQCPGCKASTVSISFTHAAPEEYRVYFTCSRCLFRISGRHVGKPAHFSQERVDRTLQAFDIQALQNAKFPRP